MAGFLSLAKAIDSLNNKIGHSVAWLALFMVLVQFIVVLMRYVFGIGSIFMQESIIYMHGFLFMLGAGYTLLHGGHVRVDIFYGAASERKQAIVDFFGSIFLLFPVLALILIYGIPYVASSWEILESSQRDQWYTRSLYPQKLNHRFLYPDGHARVVHGYSFACHY